MIGAVDLSRDPRDSPRWRNHTAKRTGSVRVMAGRPSIVPEYISILLRTIETTQSDPARLRSLVYDVARLSLGKHVLMTYHQIGSAGLQQHISDLETAISHAEDIAQEQLLKKEA